MDKEKILLTAKNAAYEAANFLLENNGSFKHIRSEIGRDIKIEADIQSEKKIIEFLSGKTSFSILSEEKGLVPGEDQEYIWIVDPIDGSLNYLRGIPICCISIGLWKDDHPVLGVIYDFNRNEMFSGIVGEGAWLNDQPIAVSQIVEKEKAVLCTGFPFKTNYDELAKSVEEISTKIGNMVRESRRMFLHKGAWFRYKGYAFSQIRKMVSKDRIGERKEDVDKWGYDRKFAYHTIRLLNEIEQILIEGDLDLQRNKEQLKSMSCSF